MTKNEALRWLIGELHRVRQITPRDHGLVWLVCAHAKQLAVVCMAEANERHDWIQCVAYQHIYDQVSSVEIVFGGTSAEALERACDMIRADVRWWPIFNVLQSLKMPTYAQLPSERFLPF